MSLWRSRCCARWSRPPWRSACKWPTRSRLSARNCSSTGSSGGKRAHYEVERAARQYHCVEPEHRLVARTLEHQWEDALNTEATLKADYERFVAEHPCRLSVEQREAIRRLATDIPALWHASSTTPADRQAIVRQLV